MLGMRDNLNSYWRFRLLKSIYNKNKAPDILGLQKVKYPMNMTLA